MIQKTAALLQGRKQNQRGVPRGEDENVRREVESQVEQEDYINFYDDNPVSKQLGPELGRMLKEKSSDYEDKVRDGAKGTRG